MTLEELNLPAINATLNGVATVLLSTGFILIMRKRVTAHRNVMLSAFVVSIIFLIGYVTNRVVKAEAHTEFVGEGIWPWIYYPMLISHIILAMLVVPLVLRTLYLALRGRYPVHRKWARVTFPIWYYVSITGVLVYFFLYEWFPAPEAP